MGVPKGFPKFQILGNITSYICSVIGRTNIMYIEKNTTNQKRLRILNEDEIQTIYSIPNFTYEDRCQYFSLTQPEKE